MTRKGRGLFVFSFLAPAVTIYALFVVWPLIQAFGFSGFEWSGLSDKKSFVGAQNYRDLVHDDVFWRALRNNVTLLVGAGVVILILSLLIASAMQGQGKWLRVLRGVYLLPQSISLVVVAILWMFIFNPQFGLVNSALNALHLSKLTHTWLGDPNTALPSVAVAFVWYGAGFYIMLFSAAMRSMPAEVSEAAELDGARGLRRFFKVTWPMLWSVKRVAIVHLTIAVMNVFALVLLMTQGGPDRATESLLTYLYQKMQNSEMGYATTIAVANFAVVMIISLVILLIFRKDPQEARR